MAKDDGTRSVKEKARFPDNFTDALPVMVVHSDRDTLLRVVKALKKHNYDAVEHETCTRAAASRLISRRVQCIVMASGDGDRDMTRLKILRSVAKDYGSSVFVLTEDELEKFLNEGTSRQHGSHTSKVPAHDQSEHNDIVVPGHTTTQPTLEDISANDQEKEEENPGVDEPPKMKIRVSWNNQLKMIFKKVVDSLGGPIQAKPKQIKKAMRNEGITNLSREHIASHLQKYRKSIEKRNWEILEESKARVQQIKELAEYQRDAVIANQLPVGSYNQSWNWQGQVKDGFSFKGSRFGNSNLNNPFGAGSCGFSSINKSNNVELAVNRRQYPPGLHQSGKFMYDLMYGSDHQGHGQYVNQQYDPMLYNTQPRVPTQQVGQNIAAMDNHGQLQNWLGHHHQGIAGDLTAAAYDCRPVWDQVGADMAEAEPAWDVPMVNNCPFDVMPYDFSDTAVDTDQITELDITTAGSSLFGAMAHDFRYTAANMSPGNGSDVLMFDMARNSVMTRDYRNITVDTPQAVGSEEVSPVDMAPNAVMTRDHINTAVDMAPVIESGVPLVGNSSVGAMTRDLESTTVDMAPKTGLEVPPLDMAPYGLMTRHHINAAVNTAPVIESGVPLVGNSSVGAMTHDLESTKVDMAPKTGLEVPPLDMAPNGLMTRHHINAAVIMAPVTKWGVPLVDNVPASAMIHDVENTTVDMAPNIGYEVPKLDMSPNGAIQHQGVDPDTAATRAFHGEHASSLVIDNRKEGLFDDEDDELSRFLRTNELNDLFNLTS